MTSLLSSASRTIGCKGGHCPLVQATPCVASLCPVQIPPGITVSDSPIIFTFSSPLSLFFYSSPFTLQPLLLLNMMTMCLTLCLQPLSL